MTTVDESTASASDRLDAVMARRRRGGDAKRSTGRADWASWPTYDAADAGLRNYWYPVEWSAEVGRSPRAVRVCGEDVMLQRDGDGAVHALRDRCPHRGVPLSMGKEEFPGTVTCPYHAWTFRLSDGELVAVITDGPDSPMCGKVSVQNYPTAEAVGLVWVFVGDREPHPLTDQLPEELVDPPSYAVGGRIEDRQGDWRLYAENGFDEGHAKYLHRTSYWRIFKMMPTWNVVHIERHGRWIYRIEDERHWDAEFPGLGRWTNDRWWKLKPKQQQGKMLGNTGGSANNDAYIAGQDFPGFASLSAPGVLRIAYPQFIHYEFYVPIEEGRTKYVGVMVQFKSGLKKAGFFAKYLGGIRWLFHGNFSEQDGWMVEATDAPPERLYRPDISLIEWRRLIEEGNPFDPDGVPVSVDDNAAGGDVDTTSEGAT
ncbi:MAG: Rieske 2Fe-2S domain-containing protein [Ilumatobacter sp.]|uniref:Rieske 2Fe-2S domain-containing protein n=1 Tax=Ilumatobacter sp. TaxID=1967498 RepID=UPI00391CAE03